MASVGRAGLVTLTCNYTTQLLKEPLLCCPPCSRDPLCVLRSMRQVGPRLVLSWVRHFLALTLFTLAYAVLAPLARAVPPLRRSWRMRRLLDALRWGAGLDYRRAGLETANEDASVPAATAPAPAAT